MAHISLPKLVHMHSRQPHLRIICRPICSLCSVWSSLEQQVEKNWLIVFRIAITQALSRCFKKRFSKLLWLKLVREVICRRAASRVRAREAPGAPNPRRNDAGSSSCCIVINRVALLFHSLLRLTTLSTVLGSVDRPQIHMADPR